MSKTICVYCASSNKVDDRYFDAAERLARHLAAHGVAVVYGGGGNGLMGRLADTMLEHGGKITGIMPAFMKDVEWAHGRVENIEFVPDMHARKKRLLEGTDALVALPGGCGTLEELLEAITLKRLGQYARPIIILNVQGFYDPLIAMLDKCIAERFMAERHREMWIVVLEPEEVIGAIDSSPVWPDDAISFAALV